MTMCETLMRRQCVWAAASEHPQEGIRLADDHPPGVLS